MNRQCKCTDCGYVFDFEDRTVYKESHGFDDGFYETFSCCPNCGGDFEDAVDCCECGETFAENELFDGWCESCLRNTINYETLLEYCESNKEDNYIETFVMCYLLNCDEVPKYPSWDFHQLMIETYKRGVSDAKLLGGRFDFLEDCIRFIMDDYGSIGRENYADWLNNRKVVK